MSFKIYKTWYQRADVKFEIIKQLKNREFALIVPNHFPRDMQRLNIRMLKCHNVQSFDLLLRAYNVLRKPKYYNFYYSLGKYINGIPNQNIDLTRRNNVEWRNNHTKSMIGYDFLLDIDADTHSDIDYAYDSAMEIKKFFDVNNCPYELRFSGLGFHFIIPSMFMPKLSFTRHDKNSIYKLYFEIAQRLNSRFSELIDMRVYDSRRVCKLLYSLSLYKNNVFVCYPFVSSVDFRNFNLERYQPYSFLSMNLIRDIGSFVFNHEGSVHAMLKRLNIKVVK